MTDTPDPKDAAIRIARAQGLMTAIQRGVEMSIGADPLQELITAVEEELAAAIVILLGESPAKPEPAPPIRINTPMSPYGRGGYGGLGGCTSPSLAGLGSAYVGRA